jgi:hypothetical protein
LLAESTSSRSPLFAMATAPFQGTRCNFDCQVSDYLIPSLRLADSSFSK